MFEGMFILQYLTVDLDHCRFYLPTNLQATWDSKLNINKIPLFVI